MGTWNPGNVQYNLNARGVLADRSFFLINFSKIGASDRQRHKNSRFLASDQWLVNMRFLKEQLMCARGPYYEAESGATRWLNFFCRINTNIVVFLIIKRPRRTVSSNFILRFISTSYRKKKQKRKVTHKLQESWFYLPLWAPKSVANKTNMWQKKPRLKKPTLL